MYVSVVRSAGGDLISCKVSVPFTILSWFVDLCVVLIECLCSVSVFFVLGCSCFRWWETYAARPVRKVSGGLKCALAGVPWRGSVSARLAWGDLVSFNMLSKVLKMLSIPRRQGTPMTMRAHLQLPESRHQLEPARGFVA